MDGDGKKPRGGKKPARLAPAIDATQQQPAAARAVLETPALSDDNATAAQQVDDGQPVASVDESRGGGGAEEEEDNPDDDEQVERFYALLANIRTMRGLAPHNMVASSSCGGAGDTAGDSARKKRLRRSAEPPWRPVFRMEDFEEPPPTAASTSTSCKMRKRTRAAGHDDHGHGEGSGGSARPPVAVVASSSSSMPHAAVRFQQSDDSRSCSRD